MWPDEMMLFRPGTAPMSPACRRPKAGVERILPHFFLPVFHFVFFDVIFLHHSFYRNVSVGIDKKPGIWYDEVGRWGLTFESEVPHSRRLLLTSRGVRQFEHLGWAKDGSWLGWILRVKFCDTKLDLMVKFVNKNMIYTTLAFMLITYVWNTLSTSSTALNDRNFSGGIILSGLALCWWAWKMVLLGSSTMRQMSWLIAAHLGLTWGNMEKGGKSPWMKQDRFSGGVSLRCVVPSMLVMIGQDWKHIMNHDGCFKSSLLDYEAYCWGYNRDICRIACNIDLSSYTVQ